MFSFFKEVMLPPIIGMLVMLAIVFGVAFLVDTVPVIGYIVLTAVLVLGAAFFGMLIHEARA